MARDELPDWAPNLDDRYSVADYLLSQANFMLDRFRDESDNATQDFGSRTIEGLLILGISKKVLCEAICLFYRDNPDVVDRVKSRSLYDADYLSSLRNFFNSNFKIFC